MVIIVFANEIHVDDNELNEEAMLKLQSLKVLVDDYCQANGITVESPATFMA